METYDHSAQQMSLERYINASQLQSIAKGIICLAFKTTTADVDYHDLISQAAQELGYAMPQPILFADTNWVKDEFGFVVNPGTGKLELWRVDLLGPVGSRCPSGNNGSMAHAVNRPGASTPNPTNILRSNVWGLA